MGTTHSREDSTFAGCCKLSIVIDNRRAVVFVGVVHKGNLLELSILEDSEQHLTLNNHELHEQKGEWFMTDGFPEERKGEPNGDRK